MSGKNLVCRTIAPRLSELLTETYELLEKTHPDTENFALLIRNDGKEMKTRVIPLTSGEMNELYEASNDKVRYTAHTDEEHNFIGGEEK